MQVLYVLVPLSVMLVAIGVVFFIWAAKSGQFDDLEGPAHRILYDEDEDMIPKDARIDEDDSSKEAEGSLSPNAEDAEGHSPEERR